MSAQLPKREIEKRTLVGISKPFELGELFDALGQFLASDFYPSLTQLEETSLEATVGKRAGKVILYTVRNSMKR